MRRLGGNDGTSRGVIRAEDAASAEDIVFDKAEEAERSEKERERLLKKIGELEDLLKDSSEENRPGVKKRIERARRRIETLDKRGNET